MYKRSVKWFACGLMVLCACGATRAGNIITVTGGSVNDFTNYHGVYSAVATHFDLPADTNKKDIAKQVAPSKDYAQTVYGQTNVEDNYSDISFQFTDNRGGNVFEQSYSSASAVFTANAANIAYLIDGSSSFTSNQNTELRVRLIDVTTGKTLFVSEQYAKTTDKTKNTTARFTVGGKDGDGPVLEGDIKGTLTQGDQYKFLYSSGTNASYYNDGGDFSIGAVSIALVITPPPGTPLPTSVLGGLTLMAGLAALRMSRRLGLRTRIPIV